MSSYDADFPFGQFSRAIDTLEGQLAEFSDEALMAFIHKAENTVDTDRRLSALWRSVADLARRRLELLTARRSTAGVWVAKVEAWTLLVGVPDPGSRRVLEFETCEGKDAAIIAARQLITRHADSFDHMTEVRVSVVPEIEWNAERAIAEAM